MTTVNGVALQGGGVPAPGTWGEVAAVAPFFGPTSGDYVLPVATTFQIDPTTGAWTVDLVAVPDGIAWVFRIVAANGDYINRRIVIVPNSGTYEYGELVDAEAPDAPAYGEPVWVQDVKESAQAAVDAAAGVVNNNDTITKTIVNTPTSQTRVLLDGTYVTPAGAAAISPRAGVPIAQFLTGSEVLDPTGVTDMSVIAQRALNNVSTTFGPLQIIWPEGTFRITTQLVAKSGVGIKGAGRERTTFTTWNDQCFMYGNITTVWDNVYLDDIQLEDFTIDCSGQTASGYTSSIKALYMANMRRFRVKNVRAIGSWASMFGCDFLLDAVLENCVGLNAGRGGPTDPIGTGATFAFGVGRFAGESITLINCDSYNPGSSAVFFERLESRGATLQDGVFRIIGGHAYGGAVGVIDCGAGGVKSIGYFIEGFTNCGWYVGPGGQSSVGGIKGHIDSTTVIRKGVKTGYGSVVGGHGVVIGGTPTAGGYLIEGRIEDNAGCGVYLMPGFTLSEGGLTVDRARIRNNPGGGIVASGGLAVEPGIIITHNKIQGCGVGVDLRTGTVGARIEGNSFISVAGNQTKAIRFDPIFTDDYTSIQNNTSLDTTTLVSGDTGLTNKTVANNRELVSAAVDPALLYSNSLRAGAVAGMPAGWTMLTGTGWNAVTWSRQTTGAEPDITSGAPVSGWYYALAQHGVRVSALLIPLATTLRRRGVMHSVDPATGNAVWAELDNGTGFYRICKRVSGTFTSVFTSTVPATEGHVVGIERDAGTNTFRLLIDGISIWSGTITGVAETNYVGIEAAADGYSKIADFAAWSLT